MRPSIRRFNFWMAAKGMTTLTSCLWGSFLLDFFCRNFSSDRNGAPSRLGVVVVVVVVRKEFIFPLGGSTILRMIDAAMAWRRGYRQLSCLSGADDDHPRRWQTSRTHFQLLLQWKAPHSTGREENSEMWTGGLYYISIKTRHARCRDRPNNGRLV